MTDYLCTALDATHRALCAVSFTGGQYQLGTGDYKGNDTVLRLDTPWTGDKKASDCAGFAICWCWKLVRHRPGFNKGPWASVEDDLNVNAIVEDSQHHQELCTTLADLSRPEEGDLLCYPTVGSHIGHVAIVVYVQSRYLPGRYDLLDIVQCHGPNGFKPGIVRTDGSLFMHHDANNPSNKTVVVRMKERH